MTPDFIGNYENALSAEDCQSIIDRMEEFKTNGYGHGRGEDATRRADTAFFDTEMLFLTKEQREKVFKSLWRVGYDQYVKEFDILNTFAKHNVDQIKGQITEPGQGYHLWHPEIVSAANSDRILTYILYLNDVNEGAETEFLYYRKRIPPKQGSLVIFPAHFTHTHKGNLNLSNHNKYILTGWYTFSYAD
jgi:hypothetical protein